MNPDLRRWSPWIFTVLFLPLPPLLFYLYPSSFWVGTDYQPLGLADALNMAHRIADRTMYPAKGMMGHPGVPFYFVSWLGLALTGFPVASRAPGYFNAVIEHVGTYYQVTVWLAALTGAAGVYVFVRVANKLACTGAAIVGLLIWLVSTPATLSTFLSPSIESFSILINGLFFAILVRLAHDRDMLPSVALLAAAVGAFAYLNKLSFLYVPAALLLAGISNLLFRGAGIMRTALLAILGAATFIAIVAAVGFLVIGKDGFRALLEFHKSIFLGSGMYGSGDQTVVSEDAVWHAITAIQIHRAYAVWGALAGGVGLIAGGTYTGRKGTQNDVPAAVIGIGAGFASLLSAIFVIKHYDVRYTAGVSATLPTSVIACYLLARGSRWGRKTQIVVTALAAIAIVLMARQTMDVLIPELAERTHRSQQAQADLRDIGDRLAGSERVVEFIYRTPFAGYGEGFVISYASVERLRDEYFESRPKMLSSMVDFYAKNEPGAYVIDKGHFPTAASVKAAPNLDLLGFKLVTFKDGDELIELRTAFLLIRG